MLNIRLLLNKLFTKLDIMVEPIYYVGGNDVLPAPLSKEEEEELVNKLGENDEAIRSILIERNLRLVVYSVLNGLDANVALYAVPKVEFGVLTKFALSEPSTAVIPVDMLDVTI